jgi:hypothetical protein
MTFGLCAPFITQSICRDDCLLPFNPCESVSIARKSASLTPILDVYLSQGTIARRSNELDSAVGTSEFEKVRHTTRDLDMFITGSAEIMETA